MRSAGDYYSLDPDDILRLSFLIERQLGFRLLGSFLNFCTNLLNVVKLGLLAGNGLVYLTIVRTGAPNPNSPFPKAGFFFKY